MPKAAKYKPFHNKPLKCWEVNVPPRLNGGRRGRRRFDTQEAAWEFADTLKERADTYHNDLLLLNRMEVSEASEVYQLLKATGRPYNLAAIVRDWIRRQKEPNASASDFRDCAPLDVSLVP